jgi:glutamate dehydrogenase (NAD(P)+)
MSAFERAADLVGLDGDVRQILTRPANEITVHFPVKMDDGRVEMFSGFRVQHNNALGPYMGGLRYHPSVNLEAMRMLAAKKTFQAALLALPFGGSMGGIQIEPGAHTLTELEQITRRFVYSLDSNIGPEYDILSPDVNTNPQIMAWILDTFASTAPPQERNSCTHVVTGKPLEAGGSSGREKATGQGAVILLRRWAEDAGFNLAGATYVLQGFGSVGASTAGLLKELGAKLLAVEDVTGAIADPSGIDPGALELHRRRHGFIFGYQKARKIPHEEFMRTKADVFVTASIENQVTAQSAPLLDVKLVAEGANGAVSPDGEADLQQRGIEVLPDLLCNAGGPIVSYYEWLQNRRGDRWELEEVDSRLQAKVLSAYGRTRETAARLNTDLRTAAYAVAMSALEKVYKERGIFP